MLLEALEKQIQAAARLALAEDVGPEDITAALIPAERMADAGVITREDAILCGRPWFNAIYNALDTDVQISWQANDGDAIKAGQTLCTLQGPARALLTGERAALNFLQTLSGTATLARQYVDAVRGHRVAILDTRKTIPGLRGAQKYAVRTGGAYNHRMGLYDGILIKENHIAAVGSITAAITAARAVGHKVLIEVEVEDLAQLTEGLDAGADMLLLDNFGLDALRSAVELNAGRAKLEASGGITLQNVAEIAATGVDFISVGDLTKNVRAVDLSMRFT